MQKPSKHWYRSLSAAVLTIALAIALVGCSSAKDGDADKVPASDPLGTEQYENAQRYRMEFENDALYANITYSPGRPYGGSQTEEYTIDDTEFVDALEKMINNMRVMECSTGDYQTNVSKQLYDYFDMSLRFIDETGHTVGMLSFYRHKDGDAAADGSAVWLPYFVVTTREVEGANWMMPLDTLRVEAESMDTDLLESCWKLGMGEDASEHKVSSEITELFNADDNWFTGLVFSPID